MRASTSGVPQIKRPGTPPPVGPAGEFDAGAGAAALAQLATEARDILQYYEEQGVLLIRGGLEFELITNIAFGEGWRAAMDYLDSRMQIAIELQTLTSDVRPGQGTRALGDVQQQTKISGCQLDARLLEPWLNEEVVGAIIRLNEPNVDPDDLPEFRFRIHDRIEESKANAFVAMGGELDAELVADAWHLPMAQRDAPERPVLKQQTPPQLLPGDDEGDEAGDPRDEREEGGPEEENDSPARPSRQVN
jgi:phage gp29-like protein